ncbi:MAG: hypothetical protein RJQ14_01095 [Marinoscillum sp.]
MRKILIILIVVFLSACSGNSSENPAGWEGSWKATWETDPASFEGIDGITSYTMPGKVTFNSNQVNIKAFGFEGCVFSKDTLDHSLRWRVSNDSLILINDEETPGMVYLIKEKSDNNVRLQLMEDIFLNLEK